MTPFEDISADPVSLQFLHWVDWVGGLQGYLSSLSVKAHYISIKYYSTKPFLVYSVLGSWGPPLFCHTPTEILAWQPTVEGYNNLLGALSAEAATVCCMRLRRSLST